LIREATELELPLRAVFEHPSPRQLAVALDRAEQEDHQYDPVVILRSGPLDKPLFCAHPAGGLSTVYRPLAEQLDMFSAVIGFQARGIENALPPHASIEDMAECYLVALENIQPAGPYNLLGWSLGGLIALEMAHQLESLGHSVASLILLDARLTAIPEDVKIEDKNLLLTEVLQGFGLTMPSKIEDAELAQSLSESGLLAEIADSRAIEAVRVALIEALNLTRAYKPRVVKAPIYYIKAADNDESNLPEALTTLSHSSTQLIETNLKHVEMCNEWGSSTIAEIIRKIG